MEYWQRIGSLSEYPRQFWLSSRNWKADYISTHFCVKYSRQYWTKLVIHINPKSSMKYSVILLKILKRTQKIYIHGLINGLKIILIKSAFLIFSLKNRLLKVYFFRYLIMELKCQVQQYAWGKIGKKSLGKPGTFLKSSPLLTVKNFFSNYSGRTCCKWKARRFLCWWNSSICWTVDGYPSKWSLNVERARSSILGRSHC